MPYVTGEYLRGDLRGDLGCALEIPGRYLGGTMMYLGRCLGVNLGRYHGCAFGSYLGRCNACACEVPERYLRGDLGGTLDVCLGMLLWEVHCMCLGGT